MGEIGNRDLLPAGREILGQAAARLVVAGVADRALVDQEDAPRLPDGLRRPPGTPCR